MNPNSHNPLRLNVGFLLSKSVGFSRKFEFEQPSIEIGEDLVLHDLRGTLRLTRATQGLYVEGTLLGERRMECARCLEPFDQTLEATIGELFVFPASEAEDPLLAIPETAILNLAPLLREMMLLSIPMRPLCRQDCQGLCQICGINLNEESCEHPEEEIDPRMAPLQSLLSET